MLNALEAAASIWFGAFVLTLLVEVPVYVAGLGRTSGPVAHRVVAGIAASAVTHPLLWALAPVVASLPAVCGTSTSEEAFVTCYGRMIHWFEAAIVAGEAVIVGALLYVPARRALAVSLLANAASYGVGLLLRQIGS